jgi:N-acetylneuraminate lyase
MPIKLIAAPHTPLLESGEVNLAAIESQADLLEKQNVSGVFVCGSTGESSSLTVAERKAVAARWMEVKQDHNLQVIVHVGSNCQPDSIALAEHAAEMNVDAISSLSPSYLKPRSLEDLIDYLQPITSAAESTPFFYYDIPVLTGVQFSTLEFMKRAGERLSNLAGIKFTNPNLMELQKCLRHEPERFEIWFGCDEMLLAAYALGVQVAVGSTYNFAAELYHKMVAAYDQGDFQTARQQQLKSIDLIETLDGYGYFAAAKYLMSFLGANCGPVRAPLKKLTESQQKELQTIFEDLDLG